MDVDGGETGEEHHEEESPTTDPEADDNEPEPCQLKVLLENLRAMQNEALWSERFQDASDLQTPILAILQASANGEGLSMEVVTSARNSMQRLFRASRNRGEIWLSEIFKAYADDFQLLLQRS